MLKFNHNNHSKLIRGAALFYFLASVVCDILMIMKRTLIVFMACLIGCLVLSVGLSKAAYVEAASSQNLFQHLFVRTLHLGSTGSDVQQLQGYLNAHGFPVASSGPGSAGNETSVFGPKTKAALAKFQASKGLTADGVFGPKTAAAMNSTPLSATPSGLAVSWNGATWGPITRGGGLTSAVPTYSAPAPAAPASTYSIGGTVSGLSGTLVLLNNDGDADTITSNGSFTFATSVTEGTPYDVTVQTQPAGQTCVVTNTAGTIGGSNVTNVSVSCSATLESIMVTPSSVSLPQSIHEQFTATGYYADGSTADVTTSVTWDVSDHGVATINGTGLGLGIGVGTAQVSATLDGVVGTTNVTVTDAVLASINVAPTNPMIPIAFGQQARAVGTFSDATAMDISSSVTWSSDDETVATVTSTGFIEGRLTGSTHLSASLNGVVGTTAVSVSNVALISIAVIPANSRLAAGYKVQASALGTFSDASTLDLTNQVTWDSSDHGVAALSSSGEVTGMAAGSTQVTATSGGVVGMTNLTVTNAVLASMNVTVANMLPRGVAAQATATGTFSDASTLNLTRYATWQSSNGSVAIVDNHGLVQGIASGSVQIGATLGGGLGAQSVTVTNATLVSIAITPTNPAVARGSTLQLGAIGTFSDGNPLDLTNQAVWSSLNRNVATVDDLGLAYGVAGGSTTIGVRLGAVTDSTTLFAGN